jgi:hypothetical protein
MEWQHVDLGQIDTAAFLPVDVYLAAVARNGWSTAT